MRVLQAMPRYGHQASMAAAQAFYNSSAAGSPLDIHEGGIRYPRAVSPNSSIATGCFNSCWALARNEYEAGRIDAFAMIHDDVGAQIHWLDILYRELLDTGADIISALIPIKDSRGLTSTAIDGEHLTRVRRITMREARKLPKTFTDADVPGLLINTGLWLARLGPWINETHFHVENSIERVNGSWQAITFPEDWHFSRQCRKLGLKLAVTQKVRIDHYGGHRWCNQDVWGWEKDVQNGVAPAVVPDNWRFPEDVDGWLTEPEGRALAELACGKSVLEIGVYCGRSTICMGQTARQVFACDTFDGRHTPCPRETYDEFIENLDRYGVSGRVMAAIGQSKDVVPTLTEPLEFGFVDGSHDCYSVLQDAKLTGSKLPPDALIAFHDYRREGNEDVTRAIEELIRRGAGLVRVVDHLAVLRDVGKAVATMAV